MARIEDLIARVEDEALNSALAYEVKILKQRVPFGLVFERHLPESVVLPPEAGVRIGDQVQPRAGSDDRELFVVARDDKKVVYEDSDGNQTTAELSDLLVGRKLGESIYPALVPLHSIEQGGDKPYHAVINGENYHALQTLLYCLEDQVDCIYIDPPYNTGDKSWRYNNDYVDGNDRWRHSKWLSFMEKRLELAKRLLKPDGVLIVTIDEHEVRHLGLLLEHVLPDANIQMVSTLINPALQSRAGAFGRSDEYVFFVMRGSVGPRRTLLTRDWVSDKGRTFTGTARWDLLRRSGTGASRKDSPGGFYPIYIDPNGPQFHSVGAPLPPGTSEAPSVDEAVSVLPIRKNGTEGRWQLSSGVLKQYMTQGRVRIGGSEGSGFVLYYLKGGEYDKVLNGEYPISGRNPDGSLKVGEGSEDGKVVAVPSTQWRIPSHDATQYGSRLIASFLQNSSFTYPKSVYAVQDALSFFLEDSPEATVIDFFAGSGTTLHATALLNAGDGGQRRCILVTNNEVSEEEAATLRLAGHAPGDSEWEAKGIFESVTSPRVKAALTGKLPDGTSVQGKYLDERPYADGFNENCEFFRLEYLDPEEIEVGAQFAAIHPLLWLTAGGRAKRDDGLSPAQEWSIVEAGGYAVLFQELAIRDFVTTLNDTSGIEHVFLITDSEDAFAEMSEAVGPSFETHMLYRDYLRSFRIQAVGPQ